MRLTLLLCLVLTGWWAAPALANDGVADSVACRRKSPTPKEDAAACDRALQAANLTSEMRADLLAAKARNLFHIGAIPQSDAVWQLFEAQNSTNAALWAAYGDNQRFLQRVDSAKALYEKALSLDPASFDAASGYALILERLHRPAEALAKARDLAAKAPGDRRALLLLGAMLRANGRFAEAIEPYDTIVRQEPRQPAALYWRAIARRETGDNAGAESDLTAFLEHPLCNDIDPFCVAGALAARAELRQNAGRLPEALADLDKVVSLLDQIYGPARTTWPPQPRQLLAIRAEVERQAGKSGNAAQHMLDLAQQDGVDGALRLQLRLRHGGYRRLAITGKLDNDTIEAVHNCAQTPDCKVLESL